MKVEIDEARLRLSELINLVINGKERVVICRNGHPLVDLVAHAEESAFTDPLQKRPHLAKVKILGDPTAPIGNEAWPENNQRQPNHSG